MKFLERRLAVPPWFTLSVLAIAISLTAALAVAQEAGTDKAEIISGTVINRVTRQPIPRALVTSSDQRLATLTDSEGRFEFDVPRPATLENGIQNNVNPSTFLFARKPGFLADNTARNYSPGKELTISLVPEALVVGKVTLPNSEPPDSISLEIYGRHIQNGLARWAITGSAQSRSDGEFRFADLPAGTYKVLTRELLDRDPLSFDPQGQLYGYPPAYGQNAPDFGSASAFQVGPGETATVNLSVARKAYYRVSIPVANAGEMGGLNVDVYALDHRGPGFSLGYNSQSHAIEGLLPDGTYMVEVYGFASGNNSGSGSLAITVHGAAARGPVLALAPDRSIKVDVTEEFTSTDNTSSITFNVGRRSVRLKGPRSYLSVIFEPADEYLRGGAPYLRQPTGPGDEALVIENARPGKYWVRASSNRGYVASLRSGNVDLFHDPLVIAPGGSPPPIEVTMRDDTAKIDGRVEGLASGAVSSLNDTAPLDLSLRRSPNTSMYTPFSPVPDAPAYVYCVPLADSAGQFAQIWVSPDGTFTSPPLAPGLYRVLAFDRPQLELEYRNPEAMQAYDTRGPVVRIAGGQTEHVNLPLISSSE